MSSFALSLLVAAAASQPRHPAGPPAGVFDPPPIVRHQLEEGASKQAAYEEFISDRTARRPRTGRRSFRHRVYDVDSYELDLFVDPVEADPLGLGHDRP